MLLVARLQLARPTIESTSSPGLLSAPASFLLGIAVLRTVRLQAITSASALQPRLSTTPSLDGSSPTERTPRHQPQGCTSFTKIPISRVNHHSYVQHRGRSERRPSGCLVTCGLCVHVDPLLGEKEAIFEDVLCALRLKYGKLPFGPLLASAGWPGEEIKNLSLRLLHYKREKPVIPACGVWKSRVRCKSAGGVRRRRGRREALIQDLGEDGLRLVWCHNHAHRKA